MPYAGTFDDFNDRVIQFGYLVLFAPAYSLAPVLAFINNIIEIRTSGFKMCYAHQRPVWKVAFLMLFLYCFMLFLYCFVLFFVLKMMNLWKARSGIGSWLVVLNVLGFLAVITNASMITFVGSQDSDSLGLLTDGFLSRTRMWQLWIRFVVTEHCVLLMRTVILIVSPSKPKWVTDAEEVLEYRVTNRYRTNDDLDLEERRLEEYQRKMDDGFIVMKKTLRYRTRKEMRDIFDAQDTDRSDTMDAKELLLLFASLNVNLTDKEVSIVIEEIDESGDAVLDFEELLVWVST